MGSLKVEQTYIVKFLTFEKNTSANIYKRLKKVYQSNVLPLEKVIEIHKRFAKASLPLGKEAPLFKQEPDDIFSNSDDENQESIKLHVFGTTPSKGGAKKKDHSANNLQFETPNTGRAKRKASMKAKETWQEALSLNIKEEVENIIDDDTTDLEDPVIEMDEPIVPDPEEESPDMEMITNDAEDNDYVKDFSLDSVVMPFIPRTRRFTYLAILMAYMKGKLSCPLCVEKHFKFRCHMKRHLIAIHLNHSILLDSKLSLLCKLLCERHHRTHYHCPLCPQLLYRKKQLFLHYHRHFTHKPYKKSRLEMEEKNAAADRTICINSKDGLFLVLKSTLYRTGEPLHVIRNDAMSKCSDDLCIQATQEAEVNGLPLICKHLSRVSIHHLNMAPEFKFEEHHLDGLNLKAPQKQKCIEIRDSLALIEAPLVVRWIATDETSYYSIHCEESFATFNRTLVKYSCLSKEYDCRCSSGKDHFCPYKSLAMVYNKITGLC